MTPPNEASALHPHGPDNADHELRKAYKSVIEAGTAHFWDHRTISSVPAHEALNLYKIAFNHNRRGNRLAAERWARAAKHLGRALCHEATIAYLEPRASELPFLNGATPEEYQLKHPPEVTRDLLDSLEGHIPNDSSEGSTQMRAFLGYGRRHLAELGRPECAHELLRAERVMAAHEYGRVVECMTLAHEAEIERKAA